MAENLSVSEFEKRYGKASPEPESLSLDDFEKRYATPDPRGMMASGGMGGRAGGQVLAPKNPRALLDAAIEAARINEHLPGAVASVVGDYAQGGLKGLGRMAAPLVKAWGLGNDYTDPALAPENDVESFAGGAAQVGATTLATMALGGPLIAGAAKAGVPQAVLSPVGLGTTAAVGTKAAGGSNWDAAQNAMMAASLGKVPGARPIAPGTGVIKPAPLPVKLTPEQIKAAVEAGPRGAAAKRAANEAKKVDTPAPQPASAAPAPKPDVAQTARDVDSALSALDKSTKARLKHVVKQAQKEGAEVKITPDTRTEIAKHYNIDPKLSSVDNIHPTLGLPMSPDGKVMIRTLEGNTTWHTPEYAEKMAEILRHRAKTSTSVSDLQGRLSNAIESSKQPIVDRMKVPRISDNLAREQKEGLEIAMSKFGKAKQPTYADDVAERAARQKQHIADSVAKKEAKDAANIERSKDLMPDLEKTAELLKQYPKRGGESSSQWMTRVTKTINEAKPSAQSIADDLAAKVADLSQNQGLSAAQIRDILRENHGISNKHGSQIVNMVLKDLKRK